MDFKINSEYKPTGDQPEAIKGLVEAMKEGDKAVTLLGVTGSGKTFTMANVIAQLNRPALILSHNKTLAAQLYGEFKAFFPDNAVEYFVSYYDYYQPEAYLPTTDTYIEKDLAINEEIDRLRIAASAALMSGRRDIVVISSVSCLYGIGNPEDFHANTIIIKRGDLISRNNFLYKLVDSMYSRNDIEFKRGTFRVKGDAVDIFPAYGEEGARVVFFGNEIDEIEIFDPTSGQTIEMRDEISIYPANIFSTTRERTISAVKAIQDDLKKQYDYFMEIGKTHEANRLKQRTEYDLEMIKELGYCPGIENYSRYFDGRAAGTRPFCLLDYFPKDYITFIDESHVTVPQIRAMSGGDRSRKQTLIEYGFRLPAAADNRPLKFDE
ncbi:MAG: DEAD/DEAH box helicase family protein, partial [Candidatus Egerieousia sp.]